jgi:hypothetical protein
MEERVIITTEKTEVVEKDEKRKGRGLETRNYKIRTKIKIWKR